MRRSSHVALSLALVAGCATASPAPHSETSLTHAEHPRVKLAVLPVESDVFPRLAKGLNSLFHDVQVRGVDDYFISKVTLEVVQLSIECVDASNECWSAVGRSLAAQRLLLAQIVRGPKRHDRSLRLAVTLFDVEAGQPVHRGERQFRNEDEALKAMQELLNLAIGETASSSAATARTETAR
jgi:hypothetical protein